MALRVPGGEIAIKRDCQAATMYRLSVLTVAGPDLNPRETGSEHRWRRGLPASVNPSLWYAAVTNYQSRDRRLRLRCGGRAWWAHLAFSRINIQRTIRKKEIEDALNVVVFSMSIGNSSSAVCRSPICDTTSAYRMRRRQQFCRTRRYEVECEAQTLPSGCARTAIVPVGTCRYSSAVTMSSIARTSSRVSRMG